VIDATFDGKLTRYTEIVIWNTDRYLAE
jgi:hypothetical protein